MVEHHKHTKRNYKRRYNITIEEYNKMAEKQKHLCKICDKTDEQNKKLCIDHCHATGKIRGLLCHKCNRALGQFQENIKIIERALQYLKDSFDVV